MDILSKIREYAEVTAAPRKKSDKKVVTPSPRKTAIQKGSDKLNKLLDKTSKTSKKEALLEKIEDAKQKLQKLQKHYQSMIDAVEETKKSFKK